MTVTTTTSRVEYTGNGVTTDYAIPFPAFAESHIQAYVDGVRDFNVSVSGDITLPGATLVFATAPPDGDTVLIIRQTPLIQGTEYTTYGEYKAEQHESDYDYQMMINQEQADALASGVVLVPLPNTFEDEIEITFSGQPGWEGFKQQFFQSLFGGPIAVSRVPPIPGELGIWSVQVWDEAGNLRDMNLFGTGLLEIPGQINLDHQETPEWRGAQTSWGTTIANSPWLRTFFNASGAERDAIAATGGTFVSWDLIAADGSTISYGMDPVRKVLNLPITPPYGDNSFLGTTAVTIDYVDAALAAAGVGADPTFNSASFKHQTDEPTYGNVTISYDTEATIVTGQVVEFAFDQLVSGPGNSQGYWFKTNDEAGATHNFLFFNDQFTLPADPTAPTSAANKSYVDSVAGGSPTPVVDSLTFNNQQDAGATQAVWSLDLLPFLGSVEGMLFTPPAINNFSWDFQTTNGAGTIEHITMVAGEVQVTKDPTSPNALSRKAYVDAQVASVGGNNRDLGAVTWETDGSGNPNDLRDQNLVGSIVKQTDRDNTYYTLTFDISGFSVKPNFLNDVQVFQTVVWTGQQLGTALHSQIIQSAQVVGVNATQVTVETTFSNAGGTPFEDNLKIYTKIENLSA